MKRRRRYNRRSTQSKARRKGGKLRILRSGPGFVAKQARNGAIILVGKGQYKGRARIVGRAKWSALSSRGAALGQAVAHILASVRPLGSRKRGRR